MGSLCMEISEKEKGLLRMVWLLIKYIVEIILEDHLILLLGVSHYQAL